MLFNGRTGALVRIDAAEEADKIRKTLDGDGNYRVDELLHLGFLWDGDEKSEIDEVVSRRRSVKTASSCFEITISPTYACNFRCKYCYVDFDKDYTAMNSDIEVRVLKFMGNVVGQFSRTNVTWFGGEPLLVWELVSRMARELSFYAARQNVRIEQFLTTNGYLLTAPVADSLVESGINWFHVTIDGSGNGQDSRRVLRDGTGTYEVVLANFIRMLKQHPKAGGTLRMNLEPDSIESASPLLDEIPEELRGRIQVHPTPVIREGVLWDKSLYRDIALIVFEALRKGYAYYDNDIPAGRQFHCNAEYEHDFQIGSDGSLHKCSPSGKPEVTVGYIDENGKPRFNIQNQHWMDADEVDRACTNCEYLCFCQGGCRLIRIRNTKESDCRDKYSAMEQHVVNRWYAEALKTGML